MIKVINSTLPIIINSIKVILEILLIALKLKSFNSNRLELTVFIIVKIPSLNESVKDMPDIDNKEVTTIKEIKNIKIVKKYLLITL